MDTIQTNISDEVLVTAIRANLSEFYRHLSRSLPEEQLETKAFTRWHSAVRHPWFDGVLSSQPPQEKDQAFIEATIQYFRSNQVDAFTWWLDPQVSASDWKPVLAAHGFSYSDDTPGMAAELTRLDESRQVVENLEILPVTQEEALRSWVQVFVAGYELPPSWETPIYNLWRQLGLSFPIQNYLGVWNGKPVATSCLFYGGGAAGIYSVSTLPEARGKGIGAAMTLRPLQDARARGYRIGVLQSSEMGYQIYKKLGFRHLCQIEYFYLALL